MSKQKSAKAAPAEGVSFEVSLGQMENIVLAFADKNGFFARAVGAQSTTERSFRLFLYTGVEQAYVDVHFSEEAGDRTAVKFVDSEPSVSQHKDTHASLLQYTQEVLK